MPNEGTTPEQAKLAYRARQSWRVRACAAGLCTGAQVFVLGAGVAMPIALNGAWLSALSAPAAAAAAAFLCRRALVSRRTGRGKGMLLLLALALLLNAALAVSALVVFAEQTLLPQSHTLFSAGLAVLAALLCALSGGTGASRLCFALRWSLPLGIAALAFLSAPLRVPDGLFPVLGAGAPQVGLSALLLLGGAAPVLMLLLPPPELEEDERALDCPVPEAGFFVWRVAAGACVGVVLLFAASAFSTYEAIAQTGEWGARLRIAAGHQMSEGLAQMLLTVLEALSMILLAASMLCAGEQALVRAVPGMKKTRRGLLLLAALLFALQDMLIALGFSYALSAAPLLIGLTAVILWPGRRMGGVSG